VVADAFHSETVHFADLVLPDTTYLERYDAISLLDRPISEPDAVCDSIRHPLLEIDRNVRPWQEVLIELGARLKLPVFTNEDGTPKYEDYKDFIIRYERYPGVGFLAGWRGKDGSKSLRGEPNPKQWDKYIENQGFFQHHLPMSQRYFRFGNKEYLEFAKEAGFNYTADPIVIELYSESIQRFRLAGLGLYDGPQPKDPVDRERLAAYFDPLPDFYEPLEQQRIDKKEYPFLPLTSAR